MLSSRRSAKRIPWPSGRPTLAGVDLDLAGKRALVTGASKGIGLAVVRAFVAEGATVVAGARSSSPELDELIASGQVQHVAVDLSTAEGPGRLVDAALEGGALDVLVNNVGAVTPRLDGFLAVTDEQWWASLNLTFMAAVRTTRAVLPGMLDGGRGSIVTVSSVNASLPDPGVIDYSAAKAALSNFCKSLSKEVGPQGVRVNTVDPGPVTTGLWLGTGGVAATVAAATGGDAEAIAEAQAAEAATGRFTYPEEVANLVVLLASERAANVTGTGFTIDGGLITTM
jgi:NAD(P)-dependent dehydrogenase (short-subunit alcohol dehydrogenase family)